MEKALNKRVSALQKGIKKLYYSSKYKSRIAICCILALFFLICAIVVIYNASLWRGTVIVLSPSKSAYQALYTKNLNVYGEKYSILDEIGLPAYQDLGLNEKSIVRFEKKANVKRATNNNDWEVMLSSYGILDLVDLEQLNMVNEEVNKLYSYLIVLNEKNEIVYQGYDRKTLVETLIKLGVKF